MHSRKDATLVDTVEHHGLKFGQKYVMSDELHKKGRQGDEGTLAMALADAARKRA
jgi:hypothetical protein